MPGRNIYSANNRDLAASPLRYIDWPTLIIYLIMVLAGAISIYAATYQFDTVNKSIFSLSEFSGKQIMWIGVSLAVGFCILLLDRRFYDAYAYLVYIAMMALLLVTIFIAPDIKGSRSWLTFGSFSVQPAEFGKFATALALAKLFSGYNFNLNRNIGNYFKAAIIILLPIVLIIFQRETGSALVYTSLVFVLYREGMTGFILFAGLCAIAFFVVAIKYAEVVFWGIPLGEAIVFIAIMAIIVALLLIYCRSLPVGRNVTLGYLAVMIASSIVSLCGIDVNGRVIFIATVIASVIYISIEIFRGTVKKATVTIIFAISAVAFLYLVNAGFNSLEVYQQQRIKVTLGIENDIRGIGYNVNQSKIAIGSGGFAGKGFLNGTQTKLRYVPEQHTDFIFCTIGEEEGFLGSALVLLLFTALILRVIVLAERQRSAFGRVYAYSVASFLIFHLAINIGMVIGLCPVIGIPLPLFSYGGSSVLGFSILLFLLLRIDASRREFVN